MRRAHGLRLVSTELGNCNKSGEAHKKHTFRTRECALRTAGASEPSTMRWNVTSAVSPSCSSCEKSWPIVGGGTAMCSCAGCPLAISAPPCTCPLPWDAARLP